MQKLLKVILFLIIAVPYSQACNLSDVSLISVNYDGVNYTISMQLNIGAGVTGATSGGDNSTNTFAYAAYSTDATMSLVSFSPPAVTSDTTACTMTGTTFTGSFGANLGVVYVNSGCDYTCISSTAVCGFVHQQIDTLVITTNILPDSIKFFGIEGAGNPFAGCYPDIDMTIRFNMTLPVDWGKVETRKEDEGIRVLWNTYYEQDNNFFQVEKSLNGVDWRKIGTVNAVGYSTSTNHYGFLDKETVQGTVYYRIKQVDIDDAFSYSEIASFNTNQPFDVKLYPSPVNDILIIDGIDELEDCRLEVHNLSGQMVYSISNLTNSESEIDLSFLNSGVYLIKLQNSRFSSLDRIVKN